MSFFLPLLRLRFNTLRPLSVAIRLRKPCTLLRWRFLGWNVLFIIKLPRKSVKFSFCYLKCVSHFFPIKRRVYYIEKRFCCQQKIRISKLINDILIPFFTRFFNAFLCFFHKNISFSSISYRKIQLPTKSDSHLWINEIKLSTNVDKIQCICG